MSPINSALRAPLAIMFLVFMTILGVFSFGFARSAGELRTAVHESCLARQNNDTHANDMLDQLIDAAARSAVFSPAEKAERIAGWRAVRRPPEACAQP